MPTAEINYFVAKSYSTLYIVHLISRFLSYILRNQCKIISKIKLLLLHLLSYDSEIKKINVLNILNYDKTLINDTKCYYKKNTKRKNTTTIRQFFFILKY